ncbi:MAG: pyridoxamine 5'-phosphate oxidase family protein [Actinomycetota bacterium]|nr:pyridoxamine 5'-phosphate oxidase family protein [Actinomycetota bacterium]
MPKLDLSLTSDEVDAYLAVQRTIRLATVSADGSPHVVPLWFVWVDGVLFMNSTRGNLTVRNAKTKPTATGVVDDGEPYDQLRGVIVRGRIEWGQDERQDVVNRTWSDKYLGGSPVPFERWKNRVWFRLIPEHISSWDFRKIPAARANARGSSQRA